MENQKTGAVENIDGVTTAKEALSWLYETYPGAYFEHDIKAHVPGKYVEVEARIYNKEGRPLATDGRFKYAEHERDDDYYGWAITQAIGRAAKKVMMLHGVVDESYTEEEFINVVERKITELNTLFSDHGEPAAKDYVAEHTGPVRNRLQQRLNHLISGKVMEPKAKPRGRKCSAPKDKDKLPYD